MVMEICLVFTIYYVPCHSLQIFTNFVFEGVDDDAVIRGPEHHLESVAENIKRIQKYFLRYGVRRPASIQSSFWNSDMYKWPGYKSYFVTSFYKIL